MLTPELNSTLETTMACSSEKEMVIPSSQLPLEDDDGLNLKILVVDDEKPARKHTFFLLKELGYSCLYESGDGLDALEQIRKTKPAIVISDIQMPGLSGIELLEQCKADNLSAIFIFISGYDLFEYAQKAIQLGAQGYLLKPFDSDELKEVMDNVKDKLAISDVNKDNSMIALEQRNHDHIISLLKESSSTEEDINVGLEVLGLQTDGNGFVLVEILEDSSKRTSNSNALDNIKKQYIELIKEDLKSIFPSLHLIFPLKWAKLEILLLVLHPDSRHSLKNGFTALEIQPKKKSYSTLLIAMSDVAYSLGGLYAQHKSCSKLFLASLFSNEKRPLKTYLIDENTYEFVKSDFIQVIYEHFIKYEFDEILGEINDIYDRFILKGYRDFVDIGLLNSRLISILFYIADTLGLESRLVFETRKKAEIELAGKTSTSQIVLWYKSKLKTLKKEQDKLSNVSASVLRAKQFIRQNYASPLSLESVSEIVNFSPNYFSNIFAQESGVTFRQFLFEVRIEEAKKLLLACNLKVASIAKKVGFGDVKYFYKVFKKEVGISPGKYRDFAGDQAKKD